MIYATTGTHPAAFDRLIHVLDAWAVDEDEEVVFQGVPAGFPTRRVRQVTMLSPQEHRDMIRRARVVVTHAGPATVFDVLELGKTPIVVPRDPAFGEHVDDHQLRFAARLGEEVCVVRKLSEFRRALVQLEERDAPVDVGRQERSDAAAHRIAVLVQTTVDQSQPNLCQRWVRLLLLGSV